MIQYQIKVSLPHHSYPIYIGETLLNQKNIFDKHLRGNQVMIVTNETVADLYLPTLKNTFSHLQCDQIILPDGEQYKNIMQWEKILNALAEHKHHRDSTLITLGGGVIGDLGGFAAACYQRGIDFIQVPTSLLAQVDASIGGKTAINHPRGKNLIGAFHQPNAVIIDTTLLQSLPAREFRSGLAEIVKSALIKDADFFTWLEQHTDELLQLKSDSLSRAIFSTCEIKSALVSLDEKEQNIRALLNLGHTFAHAIERELQYGHWHHGEAVAVGLVLAAKLSYQQKLISQNDYQRIENLLTKMQLPTQLPKHLLLADLIDAMTMDKKVKQNQLHFILLNAIGSASISRSISPQDLLKL